MKSTTFPGLLTYPAPMHARAAKRMELVNVACKFPLT